MTLGVPQTEAEKKFYDQLVAHKLLIPCDVPGVFGRGGVFEDIVDRLMMLVTKHGGQDGAEVQRYPPLLSRNTFVQSDYLKSFPQMIGVVHSFVGKDPEHKKLLERVEAGETWSDDFPHADLVLTPAACYPVYPQAKGTLDAKGKLVDIMSYCMRHEPSGDPARMQMFRQREYVRIGTPEQIDEFRQTWFKRAATIMESLQLNAHRDVANDPFFGRGGKMLAMNQRDQALKHEILIPICSTEKPTACVSINYHQEHFGHLFDIRQPNGEYAHTSCIGFGLERTTLALLHTHGLVPTEWPKGVREALGL